MDHRYDLSLCVHPLGADGKPLERGFPVVVHVVSDFQGEGVLIGIQQHLLWQLETSYKTGMKTITSDGTEYTFPYSVKSDGTMFVPGTAKAITRVITEVKPPSNVKKKSKISKVLYQRPGPYKVDSPTASKDPRAGSKSFPGTTKKFKMAGRKQLMMQEHLSRATELSLEPGRNRQAPSHWLGSRSATWSYWAGGATQAHVWIAELL